LLKILIRKNPHKFMSESPKILVIRLSSLGDILHALPAFEDLRTAFPHAQIDWLVAKKHESLLKTVRSVSFIRAIDTSRLAKFPVDSSAWSQFHNCIAELRQQRYDVSIDFQGLIKTAILGARIGAPMRIGFSGDQVRERPAHWFYNKKLKKPETLLHITALNQKLAELAGAKSSRFSPLNLVASKDDDCHVNRLLEKEALKDFVIINPGGGWPTKRWNPDRYGGLAAKIQNELKTSVVVTTGPGEEYLYEAITASCSRPAPLHCQVSFVQMIPLLKKSSLLIGGDTGPFHLACALGTPTVGIFGPTSPVRNGPWSSENETVIKMLPCSACHKRACTAKENCMDISVKEVFEAVKRRMDKLEMRR
jgi:lipopolysaccharide heptosyltransferase I